jgi:hypothetical protein
MFVKESSQLFAVWYTESIAYMLVRELRVVGWRECLGGPGCDLKALH